ncbi:MAG: 6-pyruvoyl tetrahydropterin synthase family protein [Pirellulales bacterium]|nr:6-pyruvoyl tetrahydropterin synthase family protein [Pirellulales bacterium]
MTERYHIRLEKTEFIFSAAHFITYAGNVCERLHGHNYRVACEVAGPLDENQYVVDFIAVRDVLRVLTAQLDHHMLLPTEHPQIKVTTTEESVSVTFEDRRWEFPAEDCILLPVANTTTELLARHIGRRLLDELQQRLGQRPQLVRIEVDENNGQIAVCELAGE